MLFFCMACGFCAAKGGAMDVQSNKKLSSLIVTVANPMQILASALTGERLLSIGQTLRLMGLDRVALCRADRPEFPNRTAAARQRTRGRAVPVHVHLRQHRVSRLSGRGVAAGLSGDLLCDAGRAGLPAALLELRRESDRRTGAFSLSVENPAAAVRCSVAGGVRDLSVRLAATGAAAPDCQICRRHHKSYRHADCRLFACARCDSGKSSETGGCMCWCCSR